MSKAISLLCCIPDRMYKNDLFNQKNYFGMFQN